MKNDQTTLSSAHKQVNHLAETFLLVKSWGFPLYRINRALQLIESHRSSEAMLLLDCAGIDAPTCTSCVAPVEEHDKWEVDVDELAHLLHLAGERFICLFQVLVRHPLLCCRQVRAIVPMQDGPDDDGYELDALLFRFVPPQDALAAHFDEAMLTLPPRWRSLAHVRLANWQETPIAFSLTVDWDEAVDRQQRLAAMRTHFKQQGDDTLYDLAYEAGRIQWSRPIPLGVLLDMLHLTHQPTTEPSANLHPTL
jgi:hypothetical protein